MLRVTGRGVRVGVHTGLMLLAVASFASAQCVKPAVADYTCRILRNATVFEATVEQIETKSLPRQDPLAPVMMPTGERLVHLRDIRAVKGAPQDVLVAPTFGHEDCYYQFRPGLRHLIVATRLGDGRLAPADLTRPMDSFAGRQEYVETLEQFTKGQIQGTISMPYRWTERPVTYSPVPEVRVTVQGAATRSTTTGTDGMYRFDKLPWGSYTIRVDLQQAAAVLKPLELQTVEVHPESSCADGNFTARSRSVIEGIVVDDRGRPAPAIVVGLHPADFFSPAQGAGDPPTIRSVTDSRGHYEFSELPPARYVVGVNSDIGPSPGVPYLETYAATAGGELIVPLAIGVRATLKPLQLTRALPGAVTGVVLNTNGEPVVGIDAALWWTTARGDVRRSEPVKTDQDGRFRIPAWQGVQYRLEVGARAAPFAAIAMPRLNESITIKLTDR